MTPQDLLSALNFRFGPCSLISPVDLDSGAVTIPAGQTVNVLTIAPPSAGQGVAIPEFEVFDLQAGAGAGALTWQALNGQAIIIGASALPSPADAQPLRYRGPWFSDVNDSWSLAVSNKGNVDLQVSARVLKSAYYQLSSTESGGNGIPIPLSALTGIAPARQIVPTDTPAESISGTALPKSGGAAIITPPAPTILSQLTGFFQKLGHQAGLQ